MKGQKQAVVEYVMACLPAFKPGDVALMMLTRDQLETIKKQVGDDMYSGVVEYGKAPDFTEVYQYARSMVMNHLKKAKELNGGVTYGKTATEVSVTNKTKSLAGIDTSILTEDLHEFVKNLV